MREMFLFVSVGFSFPPQDYLSMTEVEEEF